LNCFASIGWLGELDPLGLLPTLCDSNMLEHNHQFAKLEVFIFSSMLFDGAVFPLDALSAFVLFSDMSHKNNH